MQIKQCIAKTLLANINLVYRNYMKTTYSVMVAPIHKLLEFYQNFVKGNVVLHYLEARGQHFAKIVVGRCPFCVQNAYENHTFLAINSQAQKLHYFHTQMLPFAYPGVILVTRNQLESILFVVEAM